MTNIAVYIFGAQKTKRSNQQQESVPVDDSWNVDINEGIRSLPSPPTQVAQSSHDYSHWRSARSGSAHPRQVAINPDTVSLHSPKEQRPIESLAALERCPSV